MSQKQRAELQTCLLRRWASRHWQDLLIHEVDTPLPFPRSDCSHRRSVRHCCVAFARWTHGPFAVSFAGSVAAGRCHCEHFCQQRYREAAPNDIVAYLGRSTKCSASCIRSSQPVLTRRVARPSEPIQASTFWRHACSARRRFPADPTSPAARRHS